MAAKPGGEAASRPAAQDSLFSYALQHPLRYVWGLAADAWIAVSTIVLASIVIVAMAITRSARPADFIGRWWSRAIVWACGIDLDVLGLQHLRRGQSYVIISNHLSNFDIWCTLATLPLPIRFVAKKELLRIPLFGQALAMSDHIVIDRDDPQAAIEKINAAAANSREGIAILFYAEGTRSRDGKVHDFKKGGVSLAMRSALPIVPLSISGTRKFLPRGCKVIRPGGRVRLVLAEPIPTAGLDYEERDQLNEQVRANVISNFIEEFE